MRHRENKMKFYLEVNIVKEEKKKGESIGKGGGGFGNVHESGGGEKGVGLGCSCHCEKVRGQCSCRGLAARDKWWKGKKRAGEIRLHAPYQNDSVKTSLFIEGRR